ncbi:MAG: sugar ABC transporter permease [Lachnospiraceae bacterium]|uniref:sugar ABC transporter permease n=1 Tax=Parablautia sp. Marseille-Q6255 TaxID=3039593 RepID=UPI0024BD2766|nr:hypothetical protein [Parablautia sp. Marseille-Q6255]
MEAKNKAILKKVGIIAALGILVIIFNQLTDNAFGSQRNLIMLLKQASVLMILTSSLMMLLIEKNFDLSGGSGVYLAGTICALMIVKSGISMYIAIPVTLVLGVFMGSINGFFIGYLGLPAFIVTLAAQQIFRGIGYTLTDCATVGPMPSEFTAISETFISSYVSVAIILVILAAFIVSHLKKYRAMGAWYGGRTKLIENIALASAVAAVLSWMFMGYRGCPMAVVIATVVAFAAHLITTKTVYGRHVYLIGGNVEAARLAGINTSKRIFQSYLFEGLMYGIGGIVLTARLGGAASTGGNLLELDAVAAACIGGVSMNGGVGTVLGAACGVIILTAIDNVMSLMNISSYLQMVIKGIILLLAICIDLYTNKAKFRFKLNKKEK